MVGDPVYACESAPHWARCKNILRGSCPGRGWRVFGRRVVDSGGPFKNTPTLFGCGLRIFLDKWGCGSEHHKNQRGIVDSPCFPRRVVTHVVTTLVLIFCKQRSPEFHQVVNSSFHLWRTIQHTTHHHLRIQRVIMFMRCPMTWLNMTTRSAHGHFISRADTNCQPTSTTVSGALSGQSPSMTFSSIVFLAPSSNIFHEFCNFVSPDRQATPRRTCRPSVHSRPPEFPSRHKYCFDCTYCADRPKHVAHLQCICSFPRRMKIA